MHTDLNKFRNYISVYEFELIYVVGDFIKEYRTREVR